ncbi:ATP-binding protein [Micromonospora sp. R77]|uniref:sensor histidine kinase n=1 Tax=Micromonospora sp. R77 TaxID=2925836 RepID=UPI001F62389E|nr:ATP-binding protein [Micromonospora sp. R77]MCI4066776.1 ATP-binding protein [Micromonospora sp. R77]
MSLLGHSAATTDATGEGRANRFMVVLLGLHRLTCLAPAVVACAYGAYRNTWANLGLLATVIAWNLALFRATRRRGWFPAALVHVDVLLAGLVLVVVTANLTTDGTTPNWGNLVMQASGSLVGAALTRPWSVAVGLLALALAQSAVIIGHGPGTGLPAPALVHAVNGVACFALVAAFAVRYLRRVGRNLDRTNAHRLAAEAEAAADHARYVTRLAHHRALHDTVLTTLTVIARGAVDPGQPDLRRRCARDAEVIRGLLADGCDPAFGTVGEALREVVGEVSLLGLRIRYQGTTVPPGVPPQVVQALRAAAREALNNVVKHAGVEDAWLTVTSEGRGLRVTIVDRGRGFDLGAVPPGFGFRHSIVDRVTEVGGRARVSSEPGAGTCVELTWAG